MTARDLRSWAFVFVLMVGCSSSSTSTPGKTGGTTGSLGGAGGSGTSGQSGASGGASGQSGAGGAGAFSACTLLSPYSCGGTTFSCPSSVSDACAGSTSPSCAPTWSAALADTSFCGGIVVDDVFTCGGYDVRVYGAADTFHASFYDVTSGALVAIVTQGISGTSCQAGPASFIAPNCPSAALEPHPCPSDGGTD